MIEKIKNLIEKSNSIAIFFHVGPDGDAVGSALALKEALNNINKSVTVFSQDEIGNHFEFLNTMSIKTEIVNDKFDLGFVLDCGDVKRIGTMVDVLKNCKDVVNIDHHLNNENFTDYKIINTNASSTCEIMFYLLKDLNIKFNTVKVVYMKEMFSNCVSLASLDVSILILGNTLHLIQCLMNAEDYIFI